MNDTIKKCKKQILPEKQRENKEYAQNRYHQKGSTEKAKRVEIM